MIEVIIIHRPHVVRKTPVTGRELPGVFEIYHDPDGKGGNLIATCNSLLEVAYWCKDNVAEPNLRHLNDAPNPLAPEESIGDIYRHVARSLESESDDD